MQTLKNLSQSIIDSLNGPLKDSTYSQKSENIEMRIHYFLQDIFNLIKNIEKTSLNEEDKRIRLLELQNKYNVPTIKLNN